MSSLSALTLGNLLLPCWHNRPILFYCDLSFFYCFPFSLLSFLHFLLLAIFFCMLCLYMMHQISGIKVFVLYPPVPMHLANFESSAFEKNSHTYRQLPCWLDLSQVFLAIWLMVKFVAKLKLTGNDWNASNLVTMEVNHTMEMYSKKGKSDGTVKHKWP